MSEPELKDDRPHYKCSFCGDWFAADELEPYPWLDRQNGDVHNFLICEDVKCQERKRELPW